MKKMLLAVGTFAMFMLPAAADAAQCRDTATGKFAKCGAPGSVPASQYIAKSKSSAKMTHKAKASAMAAPAATPAKPGLMGMLKSKMKGTPAASATPAAKVVRCKNAKNKFAKCGTPGAKPM